MGYGDVLMAAGLAERRYAEDRSAGPVTICAADGSPRWHPLWEGNPAIGVRPTGPTVRCGAGCLPYLQYPRPLPKRLAFSPTYRAAERRGHLYLTEAEQAHAQAVTASLPRFILLEPSPGDRKNGNRQWPLASWQALVAILRRTGALPVVQFAHDDAVYLDSVPRLASPTFRHACALMACATRTVVLEGGLAFGAAALHVPGVVVLWGGCISAEVLAFPEQTNLVDSQPETPCGSLTPCAHCRRAWAALTPEAVAAAVLNGLD